MAAHAFTGAQLDRVGHRRRDAAWLQELRRAASSRALALTHDGVLATGTDAPQLVRLPLDEIPGGAGTTVLLGLEPDGAALFAVDVEQVHAMRPVAAGAHALGVREAGAVLPQALGGLVGYATALITWHRTHAHCARCGAVTDVAAGGHQRLCPVCGATHHPRTDPVVIMLVADGDRVLLGRQPSWPPGRWSALAGFVEAGESLEEAVVREVREEAGVEVRDPRYVASQPWPFPSSLMLAFTAAYAGGEPTADDGELEGVRWFTRAEIAAAADAERGAPRAAAPGTAPEEGAPLRLPAPLAIARRLLDDWLAAA